MWDIYSPVMQLAGPRTHYGVRMDQPWESALSSYFERRSEMVPLHDAKIRTPIVGISLVVVGHGMVVRRPPLERLGTR